MNGFISYAKTFHELIFHFISDQELHLKWLNSLSYLENCGARLIAACEHPTHVKEDMLKHAAEEFRHAFHLKKQMKKINHHYHEHYAFKSLLGGYATLQYLNLLNVKMCRYLMQMQIYTKKQIKQYAYLLVTYIIELRANELYTVYDQELKKAHSKVSVKSILLEEKEHLKEMEDELLSLNFPNEHLKKMVQIEGKLCQKWLSTLEAQYK